MKHIFVPFLCLIAATSLYAEEKGKTGSAEVNNSCAACHEQLQKESLKKPVAEWRGSVHAKGGRNCTICHGGDPTTDDKIKAKSKLANFVGKPNKKAISELCGKAGCHILALAQFKRGPHYLSVQKTGEPGCTTCHGTHNIQRTSIEVISAKSCTACHPADYSKDIISMIAGIDRSIGAIDKNIEYMTGKHADVQKLSDRLNLARHLFHQFVHVFSRQDMESTKKILELEIKSLDSESRLKVSSIRRLDMLYLIMLSFGIAIVGGITTYSIIMYSKRKK